MFGQFDHARYCGYPQCVVINRVLWCLKSTNALEQSRTMKIDTRRVAHWVKTGATIFFTAFGAYLVSAPLHPHDGDKHGGLMAVFPGLLLLLMALLVHVVGGFLNRRGNWGMYVQVLVSVVSVAAVARIALR